MVEVRNKSRGHNLNRNASCKGEEVIAKLYFADVRPHMERCVRANLVGCRQHMRRTADFLEKFLKIAAKVMRSRQFKPILSPN